VPFPFVKRLSEQLRRHQNAQRVSQPARQARCLPTTALMSSCAVPKKQVPAPPTSTVVFESSTLRVQVRRHQHLRPLVSPLDAGIAGRDLATYWRLAGWPEGFPVGCPEGSNEGCPVGCTEGCIDGCPEGCTVWTARRFMFSDMRHSLTGQHTEISDDLLLL